MVCVCLCVFIFIPFCNSRQFILFAVFIMRIYAFWDNKCFQQQMKIREFCNAHIKLKQTDGALY